MSDLAIHEMISAFAAGCMDEKNYVYFRDHIKGKGDLPAKELGELQNIMALLPLVTDEKQPAPDVKKLVAKELLKYNDEIKEKIKSSRQPKEEDTPKQDALKEDKPREEKAEDSQVAEETSSPQQTPEENQDLPLIPIPAKEDLSEPITHNPVNIQEKIEERRELIAEKEKEVSRSQWGLLIAGVVLLVSVLVGLFLVYNLLSARVADTESLVEELRLDVDKNTDFRGSYFDIVEFFGLKDVRAINLVASNPANEYSGSFYISLSVGKVMINLNKMPGINENQTYQLWARTGDRDIPLGTFIPVISSPLTEINDLPNLNIEDIEKFFITIENRPGATFPSGRSYLEGRLN